MPARSQQGPCHHPRLPLELAHLAPCTWRPSLSPRALGPWRMPEAPGGIIIDQLKDIYFKHFGHKQGNPVIHGTWSFVGQKWQYSSDPRGFVVWAISPEKIRKDLLPRSANLSGKFYWLKLITSYILPAIPRCTVERFLVVAEGGLQGTLKRLRTAARFGCHGSMKSVVRWRDEE